MKVTFPLSLKVSVWLLLNLLLLASLGGAALAWRGGIGWDSLVRGVPGERLQAAAVLLASDLAGASPEQATAALARMPFSEVVPFVIVQNNSGAIRIGEAIKLPPEVLAQLHSEPIRRPGPRAAPPPPRDDPPPPDLDPPPPGFDPPPPPPSRRARSPDTDTLARGRHLLHAGEPPAWWLIVRLPPLARGERTEPLSLVARAPSFYALLRLLDVKPWLLTAGAAIAVSILFWLPFVRSITRSLRRLGVATEKIAAGDFATRVSTGRRDEIGQPGEAVDAMAQRLDTLVNDQKKFLGDVAHELGSPLGRLQVAVEILEARADPALATQIADVREEIQQMAELVHELLAFTKAGLRPRAADLSPVALAPLLGQILAREAATQRVDLDVPATLLARADPSLLTRAVQNLVRNALRYAGDAAAIHVSATPEGDHVCIAVEDDGPGVPIEALARLGEPFYRPEAARTRESGGVGLGLSIVRSSIAGCGGTVRFSNRSPRGFRAEIRLARS
jgi:two-component system sensor histidine kinase CpxA